MALGIVLPALGVGALAIVVYAVVADLGPAFALLIYLGSSLVACAGMAVLVAGRRPIRPVESEGQRLQPQSRGPSPRERRDRRKARIRA